MMVRVCGLPLPWAKKHLGDFLDLRGGLHPWIFARDQRRQGVL
jgi:hypothetical protein